MTSSRNMEERLHEALGEPMAPMQAAALDARMERGPSERTSWLRSTTVRRSLAIVAGALVIALPLAVAAGIVPGAEEAPPPAELEGRVASVFPADACIGAVPATDQINAILADGFAEWTVQNATGAATAECVVPSFDSQTQTITLFMALSPSLITALDDVSEQTYRECLTREQATALVDEAVQAAGMTGYRVEPGSLSVPNDRVQEVEQHVANGCWVYSTTGWTADGTRVFWVSGK